MKKTIKLSMIAALSALSLSTATAGEFQIGMDIQKSELDGNFNYKGTAIDTKDTLGMTKKDTLVIPEISYVTDKHTVSFKYESADFEGDKTLTANVTFNGTTYTAATDVHSEISTKWATLGYRYHLDPMMGDKLNLKVGTDIHVIDMEASIVGGGSSEKYDVTFGLPTLAVEAMYDVYKNISVGGEVSAMTLGSYGHYLEYDAKVSVDVEQVEGLTFDVGYKSKEFDLEDETNETFNLEWSGLYAGVKYTF